MPLDDDRDEPARFGAPLPPEDRLWRHPSELAAGTGAHSEPGAVPAPVARPRRIRPLASAGVAVLTGLAGAAIAIAVVAATGHLEPPATTRSVTDAATATPVSLATATVAEAVLPTVAHLTTVRDGQPASASALIYRSDGYLLTTTQAVTGATAITAVLADGRTLRATVVGADPSSGVAVLHVPATDLQTAPISRSAVLRVGDPALAIGAPADAGSGTLTDGVVSAIGSSLRLPTGYLYDLIATDRAVPPGAEGGAMVDSAGKVAGLCVSVPAATGAQPAGYAVPIDLAANVAEQLIRTGHAEHASLGIAGTPLPVSLSRRLGVQGVQLSAVQPEGPAGEAGLRPGDIILSVGQQPVGSMAEIVNVTWTRSPGDRVPLEYLRGSSHRIATVVLGEAS